MNSIQLSLSELPKNSEKWMMTLSAYDPFKEYPNLLNFEQVAERIYGCAIFNIPKEDNDYDNWLVKARIRASIGEFVSISEMLKLTDFTINIERTANPLFHFLKELRNTTFHISSLPFSTSTTLTIGFDKSTGEEIKGTEYSGSYHIIDNCNLELFKNNRNYTKYYNTKEFCETISWVAEKQKIYGFRFIIELALKQYCKLIDTNYNMQIK